MRVLVSMLVLAMLAAAPAFADGREHARPRPAISAAPTPDVNDAARRDRGATFEGARTIYAFANGAFYQVHANPAYVSTLLLEPGETLNEIAAGDTARWTVTQAQGGEDGQARAVVLVKPRASGLRTNIVLITDRRTYLVEAVSQTGSVYSAEVAWSYPAEIVRQVQSGPAAPLDFGYRIRTVHGMDPTWKPIRVFDDGRRTWIEFSPAVAATDLPPLFVITADGAELTNYRVDGARYMVDRVFDVAELRLGTHAPLVVRIERHPVDTTPSAPTPWRRHP